MVETSRRIAAALFVLSAAAATAACSDSSTPASDGGASGGDAGKAADTGTPRADGGGECTTASDCRTYGLHCDACTCIALPVGTVDPVCNGTPVSCLVDPCIGKTAFCASGVCTIE